MKKFASAFALAMIFGFFSVTVQAAPSCVFMKFTDDTRFAKAEAAVSLSDLIMEKLVNSGAFNLKETRFIDQDIEQLLFEGRTEEFQNAELAAYNENFDILFNGAGFAEEQAQDVATARLGQIINPAVTSAIGKQHDAEYLIQGTIRGIGTGDWMDTNIQDMINTFNDIANLTGGMNIGVSFDQNVTKFGVQADVKVIKADTGKVVWHKVVTGKKTKKQSNIGLPVLGSFKLKLGSDKLDNEMYNEALEDAAEKISSTLINAANNGELFNEIASRNLPI